MSLDRKAFLAAATMKRKTIDVPDIGQVTIRQFTAGEACDCVKYLQTTPDELKKLVYVVTRSTCDTEGAPLFGEADGETLKGLPFMALRRISDEALVYSGLAKDDAAKKADPAS